MTEHTPGPWAVRLGADGNWLIAASETETTMIVVAREVEDENDARLISVVPELLAALKAWQAFDREPFHFEDDRYFELIDRARNLTDIALTKAKP